MFRIVLLLQALLLLATTPGDCSSAPTADFEAVKNELEASKATITSSAGELLKTKIDSFSNTVQKMESSAESLKLGSSCVSWEGFIAGYTHRTNSESDITAQIKRASNYTEAVIRGFVANIKGNVYTLSRIMQDSKEVLDGITLLKEELEKPENAALKTKSSEIIEKVKTVLKSNGQALVNTFSTIVTTTSVTILGAQSSSPLGSDNTNKDAVIKEVKDLGKVGLEMAKAYFALVGEDKLIKPTELELEKPTSGTEDPQGAAWYTAAKAVYDAFVVHMEKVLADGADFTSSSNTGTSGIQDKKSEFFTAHTSLITANKEAKNNGAGSGGSVGICGRTGAIVLPQATS